MVIASREEKQRWFNRQVTQLAADRNNLHHIRWGSWARDQKVPFADALHYTTRGTKTWASRVADQVSRIAG